MAFSSSLIYFDSSDCCSIQIGETGHQGSGTHILFVPEHTVSVSKPLATLRHNTQLSSTIPVLLNWTTLMVLMLHVSPISWMSQMEQTAQMSPMSHSCTNSLLASAVSKAATHCNCQELHSSLFYTAQAVLH